MYASDPFFVANPTLLHVAGAADYAGSRTKWDYAKYEKASGNIDMSYYVSLAGEHAWKAGFQWVRDMEDQVNGGAFPMVNFQWDNTCSALEAYGVDPFRGTYGYYTVEAGWNSPYGYTWKAHRDAFAIYLQDSWTINGKLTINAGVRTESEYIPAFTENVPDEYKKPIKFGFEDKIAPRFGAVYDVFGDSSLKLFGSFGIYYDVMKMYVAEGAFGGFKWRTDYYMLDEPDWTRVADTNDINDRTSQEYGGAYMGTLDWRIPSFDTLQPDLKPVAQREVSLGAEKKLSEDISVSLRLVQKHLIRTIEDIGIGTGGGEQYYEGNPGSPWVVDIFNEILGPGYWPQPKAKREYYGMNIDLVKRFSHNWQGGINYTMSLTKGNYGGLSSTDEFGRNSPNVERSFDLWFMMYEFDGTPVDGPLPQDRTHYLKAYGSYSFPMGLTVGVTAYGRSGNPMTTRLPFNNAYIYPEGYGDLGRMPWTVWADLFAEWALRLSGKYTLALNVQVNNVADTRTWQHYRFAPTRNTANLDDDLLLTGTYDWTTLVPNYRPDVSFAGDPNSQFKYNNQFGRRSLRFGMRFTF